MNFESKLLKEMVDMVDIIKTETRIHPIGTCYNKIWVIKLRVKSNLSATNFATIGKEEGSAGEGTPRKICVKVFLQVTYPRC